MMITSQELTMSKHSEHEQEIIRVNKTLTVTTTLEMEYNGWRVTAISPDSDIWNVELCDYDGSTCGRGVFDSKEAFYLHLETLSNFADETYGEKYSKFGEMPTLMVTDGQVVLTMENLDYEDEPKSRPYVRGMELLNTIETEKYWATQDNKI